MNGIVLFRSKYGSTAKYAEWIGQLCHLPISDLARMPKDLNGFDYLVIGSSVYTGKLLMRKWLKKHQQEIANKKLFIFIVGGTPEERTKEVEKIITDNISPELRSNAEIYYLAGSLNIQQLSLADKFLIRIAARLTRNVNQKQRMRNGFDQVKLSQLHGIIRSVCNYSGKIVNPEPAGFNYDERIL